MKTPTYSKFNLIVDFGNGFEFFRDIVAVDIDAAFTDVVAAYGEGTLIQWGRAS